MNIEQKLLNFKNDNLFSLYHLFCHHNGLTEGQYKNFKKFMEGMIKNEH